MILTKKHIGKRVRRPENNGFSAVEGIVLDVMGTTARIKESDETDCFVLDPDSVGAGEWELVNPSPKLKRKASISTRRCARILCKRLRMSYGSWHGLNESESSTLLDLLWKVQ
jgi:hypothetical protein